MKPSVGKYVMYCALMYTKTNRHGWYNFLWFISTSASLELVVYR